VGITFNILMPLFKGADMLKQIIFSNLMIALLCTSLNANTLEGMESIDDFMRKEIQECFDVQIISDKLYSKLNNQYFRTYENMPEYYFFRDSIKTIVNECIALPIFIKDVQAAEDLLKLLDETLDKLELENALAKDTVTVI